MGRKVHPIGFRLGVTKDWDSKWFAEGEEYARRLVQDAELRDLIHSRLGRAGISTIKIQRLAKRMVIRVVTARPGIVIGRGGSTIKALTRDVERLIGEDGDKLSIQVEEVERPELDAHVVAESIAEQLERRLSFRRVVRRTVSRTMRAGAEGIRVACKGRLFGAEMARREWVHEGRVPLHTLRADIDYAVDEAETTYGRIGVKVWIYRGDVFPSPDTVEAN